MEFKPGQLVAIDNGRGVKGYGVYIRPEYVNVLKAKRKDGRFHPKGNLAVNQDFIKPFSEGMPWDLRGAMRGFDWLDDIDLRSLSKSREGRQGSC